MLVGIIPGADAPIVLCRPRAWLEDPRLCRRAHSKTWMAAPSAAMTQSSQSVWPLVLGYLVQLGSLFVTLTLATRRARQSTTAA